MFPHMNKAIWSVQRPGFRPELTPLAKNAPIITVIAAKRQRIQRRTDQATGGRSWQAVAAGGLSGPSGRSGRSGRSGPSRQSGPSRRSGRARISHDPSTGAFSAIPAWSIRCRTMSDRARLCRPVRPVQPERNVFSNKASSEESPTAQAPVTRRPSPFTLQPR